MVDVPNVPGVPALPSFGLNPVQLLTEDLILPSIINAIAGPQWQVFVSTSSFAGPISDFLGGIGVPGFIATAIAGIGIPIPIPVLLFDSFVSFELKQDNSLSDYPVEGGGFQSYDKVQLPKEIRIQLSCGGSEVRRQAFLASVNAQMSTTLLYDIITPEQVFLNYNFHHLDYKRTSKAGVGLILIDLWLTEIRITAASTLSNLPGLTSPTNFGNTQEPGDAAQQGVGQVQGTPWINIYPVGAPGRIT